jgi:hypothetical protein
MRMMAGLRWSRKTGREKAVGGKCRVTVTRHSLFLGRLVLPNVRAMPCALAEVRGRNGSNL